MEVMLLLSAVQRRRKGDFCGARLAERAKLRYEATRLGFVRDEASILPVQKAKKKRFLRNEFRTRSRITQRSQVGPIGRLETTNPTTKVAEPNSADQGLEKTNPREGKLFDSQCLWLVGLRRFSRRSIHRGG
jgi:hypothetical protein